MMEFTQYCFKIFTDEMQLKHEIVTLNTLEFEFSHIIILAAFEFLSIIVSSVAKHGELLDATCEIQ